MSKNLSTEIIKLVESGVKFSDIHITEGEVICVRGSDVSISDVDGGGVITRDDIIEFMDEPARKKKIVLEDKISNNEEIDVSVQMEFSGKKVRFRVNLYKSRERLEMVLRKIDEKIVPLSDLGFGLDTTNRIKDLCNKGQGIIFVTGATGSGKTTTLGSMIDEINSSHRGKIITIEDPIEVVHEKKMSKVSQREIGVDTLSFGNALRAALRQDPDVIMIGEIRDRETAEIALNAALTGHLVLATMHTNDASQTIQRFVQMFESEDRSRIQSILSAALLAVISQTLERDVNKNRILISELMIANSAIKSSVSNGAYHQIPNLISESSNTLGNYLMGKKALGLFMEKKISKDVAKKIIDMSPDAKSLNDQLSRIK